VRGANRAPGRGPARAAWAAGSCGWAAGSTPSRLPWRWATYGIRCVPSRRRPHLAWSTDVGWSATGACSGHWSGRGRQHADGRQAASW